MPKLSVLTKQLKEYALNSTVSDEEFLNAFLLPFVMAGRIMNKNHEEFHLSKTRTSELMNQKVDVPTALRNALSLYGIKEKTIEGMYAFIDDYMDPNRSVDLTENLIKLMQEE